MGMFWGLSVGGAGAGSASGRLCWRALRRGGGVVKDVARRHDVSTGLVFAWRRQARQAALKDGELLAPAWAALAGG